MRNSSFWWIFIAFAILLDIYVFQAIKLVSQSAGSRVKTVIYFAYWMISVSAIVILITLPYLQYAQMNKVFRSTLFAIIAGLFFAKVISVVFFAVDDIRRLVQWTAGRLFTSNSEAGQVHEVETIPRSVFLSWAGLLAGGGLFGSLVYGFGNKYRYQLNRLRLYFPNLPAAFKGLRIVHISDIHSGSFDNKTAVEKGIEKIMNENPDLILFTGDLVNDRADEMNNYTDLFSRLRAPLGVFSTLGNHDYGDYTFWETKEAKEENLKKLKKIHADMGWRLLLDENQEIEKNGEKISLLGVQNISGKSRFKSYGNLAKAYAGTNGTPFKILMSHDPSHWDEEVRRKYPDIDLMLSGHTHGMQFGVEIPGFRWSPVQYVYKQWAGLYESENQKLYVNRGFGFIGYPGRVGILPEITLIELV